MRTLFLGLYVVVLGFPARSGAEFVWADANGTTIAPLIGGPQQLRTDYMDDAGLLWTLEVNTATVSAVGDAGRLFTQPGCTGPAYITAFPPRLVFTIVNLPGGWVRRDDVTAQMMQVASYDEGHGCLPTNSTISVIPQSGLTAVDSTPPNLGACPPLHVERR